MKEKILTEIQKKIADFGSYDLRFNGGSEASDTVSFEREIDGITFDLTLKVWVKNHDTLGFQFVYAEVEEFSVWDVDGDVYEVDINDGEIYELLEL